MEWQTRLVTLEDTHRLGTVLSACVHVPLTFALCGPLGAGKTELVRSLAEALGVPAEQVTSPTYVLMQRYRGRVSLIHMDLYRLKTAEEVWDLGIDEWLAEPAITIIEWADKFPEVWPDDVLRCYLRLSDDGYRNAEFSARGTGASTVLSRLSTLWNVS